LVSYVVSSCAAHPDELLAQLRLAIWVRLRQTVQAGTSFLLSSWRMAKASARRITALAAGSLHHCSQSVALLTSPGEGASGLDGDAARGLQRAREWGAFQSHPRQENISTKPIRLKKHHLFMDTAERARHRLAGDGAVEPRPRTPTSTLLILAPTPVHGAGRWTCRTFK